MPTYEYRCTSCEATMEVFARMSDPPPESCESCGAQGQLEKVLFAPAVHYKGSGFYSTDYKGKKAPSSSGGESKSSDSSSSGDSGSSTPAKSDSGSSSSSGSSSKPSTSSD
jgi:putative FmdB family regulatory protein